MYDHAYMDSDARRPEQVLHLLVDGVSRLFGGDASQLDALVALYAEPTHVTHPMAHGRAPVTSRADLRRHFEAGSTRGRDMRFRAEDIVIHHTSDPEVIVAEFSYRGTGPAGPLDVHCVFVVRVRNGLIVESRDYIDHAAFARAAQ
jgi:ketosteroid isomerase-like protein